MVKKPVKRRGEGNLGEKEIRLQFIAAGPLFLM